DVPGVPLGALTHVHQDDPVAQVLGHLRRVHLVDLALDLADVLRPARAHREVLESRSGLNASERIAPAWGPSTIRPNAQGADESGRDALSHAAQPGPRGKYGTRRHHGVRGGDHRAR